VKALITGGAGFIGSHLADSLLARDWEVVAVDDLSKGRREVIEHNLDRPAFSFAEMDCRDAERLAELAGGADVVVHLAASKIPREGNRLGNVITNLEGGRAALDAALKNDARYVLASTSDVYGNRPDLPFTAAVHRGRHRRQRAQHDRPLGLRHRQARRRAHGLRLPGGVRAARRDPSFLRELRRAPVPELVGRPAGRLPPGD
jgi:nucleoside-diphosphate-sugar epimerase